MAALLRITASLGLLLYPVFGFAQYPGLSGEPWVGESEAGRCSISQRLDQNSGLAKFQQIGGKRLQFTVEQHPLVAISSDARIYSAPPLWRHDQPLTAIGETQRKRGNRPFHVSADVAEKMLNSLSQGQASLVSYGDPALTDEQEILTLSPAFLYPALDHFRSCVLNLTPFDPRQADLFEVRFGNGQTRLGRQAELRLSQLVKRLAKEPDVTALKIIGFTDNTGEPSNNLEIARMRALSVENYLLATGFRTDFLKRSQLGQAQPRYSNRTAAGRASNRRVEIKIIR